MVYIKKEEIRQRLQADLSKKEFVPLSAEVKEARIVADPVNHPSHYTTGKYEVIDILEDKLSPEEFKGFLKGNILKYILRAEHKNGMEDYEKSLWYLNRLTK